MNAKAALAALLAATAVGAAACTVTIGPESPPPAGRATGTPSTGMPVEFGDVSASEAAARLCDRPKPPRPRPAGDAGAEPPAIAQIRKQTAEVRGLKFRDPVPVESVTQQQLGRRIGAAFRRTFPAELYERRSRAWSAIGVIPSGSSIRDATRALTRGAVAGYYVPPTGRLVVIGTNEPNALQQVTLAHEFTHALDDQYFDLDRLDRLDAACRDEASQAALGAVEGSAQYFSALYAQRFLSLEELSAAAADQTAPSLAGVPPFVQRLFLWPYGAGQAFVASRASSGGLASVAGALRRLPASTEQILHPEAYPDDVPVEVDVPDLRPVLGEGWRDLDVMQVGEAWLSLMLGLRLDATTAAEAAAGWEGATYRALSDGSEVVVVLRSTWETQGDARAFADAVASWIEADAQPAFVLAPAGRTVTAAWATSEASLAPARAALQA